MNNIIPIKKPKAEKFFVYLGEVDENNHVIEKAKVGIAFLKPESKTFRLKLWMFESVQYFISPEKESIENYKIVALEEYTLASGEEIAHWNVVGSGKYFGNYIKINFPLLPCELYLSLFPSEVNSSKSEILNHLAKEVKNA